jgi:formylglycine-generating enzyme required for sulfatase activity
MTYAIQHLARRFTKASLLLAAIVLASSVLSHAQQPSAGPDLDAKGATVKIPRIENSLGMQLAVLDGGAFQMGAPEYVVEIEVGGSLFRSGQIFIVDDQAGSSERFELIDADTANKRPFYHPVTFSSGKKTNQPSSPEQIAQSMAKAITAQATAGNLQITVNVIKKEMHFKGIGLFSVGRLNTDNEQYVIVRQPDRYASNDERPQHRTEIKGNLIIGVTEVTQQQWNQVMGGNRSTVQGAHLPVNNISYTQAIGFCAKLSDLPAEKAAGRTYRLPTEAEWEYACRTGNTRPYSFSLRDVISNLEDYGWYRDNAEEQLHVVAGKTSNTWGLFDMYGNVSEWCQDIYAAEYYANAPPENDPTGPTTGSRRVLRGGNFMSPASSCRSSYRGQASPDLESQLNGLRVVCIKR